MTTLEACASVRDALSSSASFIDYRRKSIERDRLTLWLLVFISYIAVDNLGVMYLVTLFAATALLFRQGPRASSTSERQAATWLLALSCALPIVISLAGRWFAFPLGRCAMYRWISGGAVHEEPIFPGLIHLLMLVVPLVWYTYGHAGAGRGSLLRFGWRHAFVAVLTVLPALLRRVFFLQNTMSVVTEPTAIVALRASGQFYMVAILEEAYFRGFLFSILKTRLTPVRAGVVSAVFFMLSHVTYVHRMAISPSFDVFAYLVALFLMGLALCYTTHRSGSIIPGILYHGILNSGTLWVTLLARILL
jgi:membrane protease YdiL (CAAX protease family)